MSGSLAPVMYWAVRTTRLMVRCRAGAIPGGDALEGAAVSLFEDLGTHAKSFQSPEGKRCCRVLFTTVLVCLDHDSLLVMWTPLIRGLTTPHSLVPL